MALADLKQVANRLKLIRGRTDLSQWEAAHEMGFKPRTYQSWELGDVETSRDNYERIAKFFAKRLKDKTITANWIIYGQAAEPALPVAPVGDDISSVDLMRRVEEKLDHCMAAMAEQSATLAEALLAQGEILERIERIERRAEGSGSS